MQGSVGCSATREGSARARIAVRRCPVRPLARDEAPRSWRTTRRLQRACSAEALWGGDSAGDWPVPQRGSSVSSRPKAASRRPQLTSRSSGVPVGGSQIPNEQSRSHCSLSDSRRTALDAGRWVIPGLTTCRHGFPQSAVMPPRRRRCTGTGAGGHCCGPDLTSRAGRRSGAMNASLEDRGNNNGILYTVHLLFSIDCHVHGVSTYPVCLSATSDPPP